MVAVGNERGDGGARLACAAATDVGRVRQYNEDAFLAEPPLFVVADGMGGHHAGDVASALVVERLAPLAGTVPASGRPAVQIEAVVAELQEVNRLLIDTRDGGRDGPQMGTTAVGLAVVDHDGIPSWLVFNVGDSRAYRLTSGRLTQITRDHSVVQHLIDEGYLPPELARSHPKRHVITRALGVDDELDVDAWVLPMVAGERFLLCSDGLTEELDDDVIEAVLAAGRPADETTHELVEMAIDRGGSDNITAVVIDVVDLPVDVEADIVVDLTEPAAAAVPATAVQPSAERLPSA